MPRVALLLSTILIAAGVTLFVRTSHREERLRTLAYKSHLQLARFTGWFETPRARRTPVTPERKSATPEAEIYSSEGLENPASTAESAVAFSTYLGGSNVDFAGPIALDGDGYVYVTGTTTSDDFPTANALHGYSGGPIVGSDLFVAKLTPGGESLVYATYLGGASEEAATAIVVDDDGRVYVAGGTTSPDFPTQGPLFGYRGGGRLFSDGFIVCLSPDGQQIEFATFLGGLGDDLVTALTLGDDGSLYAAGTTTSDDFPVTPVAVQASRGGGDEFRSDAFVAHLTRNDDGFDLHYATYLGGSWDEMPMRVATDAVGHLWVTGYTNSDDFPTQDALQENFAGPIRDGQGDVFIARMNADGTALEFSTYLGGSQDDQGTGVVVGPGGTIYVTGWTDSNEFPTTAGVYQPDRRGVRERFVGRLVNGGGRWRLDYLTRFGTPDGYEAGVSGLSVDAAGRVWISGATVSNSLATADPVQAGFGGGVSDAFVARLDDDGARLGFSTYLGGSGSETITGTALGGETICMTGQTGSPDFPIQKALQPDFDGPPTDEAEASSVFVTCFDVEHEPPSCPSDLILSSFQTTPGSEEHLDLTNAGERTVVLDNCLVGGFTETSYIALKPTGTLGAGETYRFGASGFPDVDGVLPSDALEDRFAGFALLNRTELPDGTVVPEVVPDVITSFVYVHTDLIYGIFHSDAALMAKYCTMYEGRLHDFAQNQCAAVGAGKTRGPDFQEMLARLRAEMDAEPDDLPAAFALHENYPNPFNPETTIRFDVKERVRVSLTLYDALGRRQATLVEREHAPGRYAFRFDASGWPSGVYFYVVEMGDFRAAKKMTLVR